MSSGSDETFGGVLRRFRREARLTQEELAQRANMSARSISDLERGSRQRPYRDTLQLLVAALQLSGERRAEFERAARGAPLPGAQAGDAPQPRHNLPLEASSFIGRAEQLEQARGLLFELSVRLVTMTGPGGSGKTRLALQVAASLLDDFPDGVYFVDLAPIADPALVLSEIAQQLQVKETGGQPLLDALRDYLQPRRLLLLLDNFEQVLPAAGSVAVLLGAAPGLKILITSRVRLNLQGEHDYAVPPLALPAPDQAPEPEQITLFEAVRLFLERARAMKSDFQLNSGNAAAVAEITRRLDGLPLAIELAAARVKVLPPQALLARLARARLGLLTGGPHDLPARQQTLRGAIEWSHDLLEPDEERKFRRLAVFVGGSTIEAVTAVCADGEWAVGSGQWMEDEDGGRWTVDGGSETPSATLHLAPSTRTRNSELSVLDTLASLVDKSLLRQDEVVDGEPRFTMLETIHEYAWEKLADSGELAELRRRHALYFMQLAERAAPELAGQQATWLERIEADHDNIRAALRWARDQAHAGGDTMADELSAPVIGLRTAAALWLFWQLRSYGAEGREQLERFLDLPAIREVGPAGEADGAGIRAYKAQALVACGSLSWRQGNYAAARSLLEEGLALWRAVGDRAGIALALHVMGVLAQERGDLTIARELYSESLLLRREQGDKRAIASTLGNLGHVTWRLEDYAASLELMEESLALRRELDDTLGIALTLNGLGVIAHNRRDYVAARARYAESLTLFRELGHQSGVAAMLGNLANLAQEQGDYAAAGALQSESLALRREIGDKQGIAASLGNLASLAVEQGDYAAARAMYAESLVIRRDLADRLGITAAIAGIAGVAVRSAATDPTPLIPGSRLPASDSHPLRDKIEGGARLLGAVAALLESMGAVLDSDDRIPYERSIEVARAQLGDNSFEQAWAEGRAMSLKQAIDYALGYTVS